MPFASTDNAHRQAVWMLFFASVGMLLAILGVVRRLIPTDQPAPGRRAVAHWLPVAITALVAAVLRRPDMAIGMIFGTSVAALSTVAGFVALTGPVREVPPRSRRVWSFLPVPATLLFLMGFRGVLGLFEAVILVIQGLLLLLIWSDTSDGWLSGDEALAQFQQIPAARVADRAKRPPLGTVEAIAWLLVLAAMAWAVVRFTERLAAADKGYPAGVMSATLLSIILIMPMVSTGSPLAAHGRGWAAITAQVGVVMLNIGLLLPLVIAVSAVTARVEQVSATQPAMLAILYPRLAWRMDAVVLLILSLLFTGAAQGKLRFDRYLAGWLVAGYCCYMLWELMLGLRGG